MLIWYFDQVVISRMRTKIFSVTTPIHPLHCIRWLQACEVVSTQNSARKREMDDNAKRLGTLFWKLNEVQLSPDVVRALHQMAAALNSGDWGTASQVQVNLTGSHWDECAAWLTACKRLIKTRQQLG